MSPDHINPIQWDQALGVARQSCARIFRDGGTPADALDAFGLMRADGTCDWSKAVTLIAEVICSQPARKAA